MFAIFRDKVELQLNEGDERLTIDVGSTQDANDWVNDIINAQLASLRANPTLYSGQWLPLRFCISITLFLDLKTPYYNVHACYACVGDRGFL